MHKNKDKFVIELRKSPFDLSANEKEIENEKMKTQELKIQNCINSFTTESKNRFSKALTYQPLAARRDFVEVLVIVVFVDAAFLATGWVCLADCALRLSCEAEAEDPPCWDSEASWEPFVSCDNAGSVSGDTESPSIAIFIIFPVQSPPSISFHCITV